MDPITGAVVALVLWFFLRSLIAAVIVFVGIGIGAGVAALTDRPGLGILFVVLGWLGAVAWEIFAVIQVVLEIIRIIGLVNGTVAA